MISARSREIAARLRRFASERSPRTWRHGFQSVPSRIIVSVFGAAMVTSLAVTWISTQSTESFLRAKIDQKFPTILRSTSERLELWYAQREFDIKAFAGSATVVDNLTRFAEGGAPHPGAQPREDVRRYLAYVLERFPQYRALFVLDAGGRPVAWVGDEHRLPEPRLRGLGGVGAARVDGVEPSGDQRIQVASAPVRSFRGKHLGSLHALVAIETLQGLLRSDELGRAGGIYVVGSEGEPLVATPGAAPRGHHRQPRPVPGAPSAAEEYSNAAGKLVVGSAVGFPRFGWTIVVEEPYDEAFAPVVAIIREILGINLAIVVVFGLIAFQIARSIVRPILALSEGALKIATGAIDVEIPSSPRQDEIGVLTGAFQEMTTRLRRNRLELEEKQLEIEEANSRLVAQNRELHRVSEVFEQLSITDGLTKLHNHRYFQDQLPREMKRAKRSKAPLSLILIDIDDFKQLNDRFGHAAGDAVLRGVAEVISALVRDSDLLARYGGEEFVLLGTQTALEGALTLSEKIRLAVREARFPAEDADGPKTLSITVSIGVAAFRGDEKAFFNDADRALYRAKRSGKDCVVADDR